MMINQAQTTSIDVSVPWWAEDVLNAYLNSTVRYVVIWGGFASAKSETVCRILVNLAVKRTLRIAGLRQTMKSIEQSSKAMLEGAIDTLELRPWYLPKQKTRIYSGNGSEFFFSGLSDVTRETIKGWYNVDIAFVEEANFLTRASCDVLFNRPRAPGSQIWLVFNPLTRSDPVWLDFIADGAERAKHALVLKVNYTDNPWFPPEMELERSIDERIHPSSYKHKWLGEPLSETNNPFDNEAIDRQTVPELSGKPARWWGIDLGQLLDFTVITGLDEDGMPAAFERFQATWDMTEKRIKDTVGDEDALIDATGVGHPVYQRLEDQMYRLEAYTITAKNRQMLLEGLAASLAHGEVFILEGATSEELGTMQYEFMPKSRSIRYAVPEGVHDDCIFSLALADECRRQNPASRVPFASVS